MWNGSRKRYRLCVESLEERNAPSTVLPAEVGEPIIVELPRGGSNIQGDVPRGGNSLTLAIVTETDPLPAEVLRPGVVIPRPYSGDPIGIYTVVSYQIR